jgi:hypothetical protein
MTNNGFVWGRKPMSVARRACEHSMDVQTTTIFENNRKKIASASPTEVLTHVKTHADGHAPHDFCRLIRL